MWHKMFVAGCLCALALAGAPQTNAKEHSRFVTAEMRANVLVNAEKHP